MDEAGAGAEGEASALSLLGFFEGGDDHSQPILPLVKMNYELGYLVMKRK